MRRLGLLAVTLCACAPPRDVLRPAPRCSLELPALGPLHAQGTQLLDEAGRTVALRGINAGGRSKFAPYVPFDFEAGGYDAALARYLDGAKTLGIDVLRVPFTWAAVEPAPGQYDEAFLSRYDALLDGAAARGMFTIVDFHQDIFSESLCGDGFPAWAIPDAGPPRHDCPSWFFDYGKAEVKAEFDRFWSNDAGTRDRNLALWDMLAARHAGRRGVIGFEPFNEPSEGNADVATWEATTLPRYFEDVGRRVLARAPDALVFVDAPGIEGVTQMTGLQKPDLDALVFAPHYYDANVLVGGAPSAGNVRAALGRWADVGEQWNVPVLIGETGAPPQDPATRDFLRAQLETLDRSGLGITVWEYSVAREAWNGEALSIAAADGGFHAPAADGIARPFASRLAGTLRSQRLDDAGYLLRYDATAGGVTELRVPSRGWSDGLDVQVTGGACVDVHDGVVLVKSSESGETSVRLSAGAESL